MLRQSNQQRLLQKLSPQQIQLMKLLQIPTASLEERIKEELEETSQVPKKKLNENEKKVGWALVEILENWETAFEAMTGGSKYNKNSVLETMRNYTNLSTKDIRLAMKRYKDLYGILKNSGL